MLARNVVLQGRYKIIRQLGQGGMGAVYEAEDVKRFSKEVALKEILIDLARISNPVQQELIRHAFEREAKILTQVDHEAFPQVVDYFTEDDAQFLVMELIQGQDLGELLRNRKSPFSVAEIIDWTDQLLDALDYLHTLDPPIIHRDIKPQNLKLTSRGKVKLLDFGIAKGADKQVNTTIATQTFIAATLNYSPFEQILRVLDSTFREALMPLYGEKIEHVLEQPADPRSDIYALGATLYHLLTNQVPLDALKRALGVWGGKPDALVSPIEINPNIPVAISEWLMKSMEIEWDNRFNSAIEMQAAFREAVHSERRIEEESLNLARIKEQEAIKRERLLIEQERKNMEAERQLHIIQIEERNRQISLQNLPEEESKQYIPAQSIPELPTTQISFEHQPPAPTLLLNTSNIGINGQQTPAIEISEHQFPPAPTLLLNKSEIGISGKDNGNNGEITNFSPITTLEISAPEGIAAPQNPQTTPPSNGNPPTNAMMSELSRYSYLPEELYKTPEQSAPPSPPIVQQKAEPFNVSHKQNFPIVWILPIVALVLCGVVFGLFLVVKSFFPADTTDTATNTTSTPRPTPSSSPSLPVISANSTPIETSSPNSPTPTPQRQDSTPRPTQTQRQDSTPPPRPDPTQRTVTPTKRPTKTPVNINDLLPGSKNN